MGKKKSLVMTTRETAGAGGASFWGELGNSAASSSSRVLRSAARSPSRSRARLIKSRSFILPGTGVSTLLNDVR